MRPLSNEELDQIEQNVLTQFNATVESHGTDKLVNAMVQMTAKVCRLMLQEYQDVASSQEKP